ncbi:hypothetical protein E2K93_15570 [Thalassotalea sp. HSM 43]|uniref:hypothetical protein n=1 Tax=Thalassotalea sp. HSM 43 TaxID=2552945 RepID=UPI0010804AD4|nr:hypothetical protein [Thalassotalea sp. HSM 43]QBY05693.1 hypothetical protein E2K93_15570 [Thalassotalea sp. HSM 43]
MGEWSEYFEDFPEENPANYVGGVFNPQEAKRIRDIQQKREAISKAENAKVNAMIAKAKKETKARSLLEVEDCPQCGLKELNTYKISAKFYLCECQDCGIYGKGETHVQALKCTSDAIGEFKDWREGSEF